MRLPSIKTLDCVAPGKGKTLRKLLESAAAVCAHPAAIALESACYHPPKLAHKRLAALDHEAGTYGVEYIPPGHNARSPGFEYLNTGDTYAPTIVRFDDGRYVVSSWGDIVERGNYD